MILTDEQIKEIKDRLAKVSSGPWYFFMPEEDDVEFLINARGDIPALIESHKQLRKELEDCKKLKKRYQDRCGEKQAKIWELEKELGRLPNNVPERVLARRESDNAN